MKVIEFPTKGGKNPTGPGFCDETFATRRRLAGSREPVGRGEASERRLPLIMTKTDRQTGGGGGG